MRDLSWEREGMEGFVEDRGDRTLWSIRLLGSFQAVVERDLC